MSARHAPRSNRYWMLAHGKVIFFVTANVARSNARAHKLQPEWRMKHLGGKLSAITENHCLSARNFCEAYCDVPYWEESPVESEHGHKAMTSFILPFYNWSPVPAVTVNWKQDDTIRQREWCTVCVRKWYSCWYCTVCMFELWGYRILASGN